MENINFIIFYSPKEDGEPRIPNTLIIPSMYNKELDTIGTGGGGPNNPSNFTRIFYKLYEGKLALRTVDTNSSNDKGELSNVGMNIEIY